VTTLDTGVEQSGRNESRQERDDRNLIELLQELRVAGLGVQVLFGFLLSLPFTNRFERLDPDQRQLYMATLLLAALSTALLTAPVAVHRVVFRQHRKEHLVRVANAMALTGLAAVGLSITGAVGLVSSVVTPGLAPVLFAGTAATFTALWLVVPVLGRIWWPPDPNGGNRS
jgi:hypothetical protein